MHILIVSDGKIDISKLSDDSENTYQWLDLRGDFNKERNLMDCYEANLSKIGELRNELIQSAPDKIIAVGHLEGYLWLGTIICRVFGQFNSWSGQRENPTGVTQLRIADKSVELLAVPTL